MLFFLVVMLSLSMSANWLSEKAGCFATKIIFKLSQSNKASLSVRLPFGM